MDERNRPRTPPNEEPVLPEVTEDEHPVGWGEEFDDERRDEQWYRQERPPHHE